MGTNFIRGREREAEKSINDERMKMINFKLGETNVKMKFSQG